MFCISRNEVVLYVVIVFTLGAIIGRTLLGLASESPSLIIVYNAFINTKRQDWLSVIALQIDGLVSNGIAFKAKDIYVCISTEFANETDHASAGNLLLVQELLNERIPKAKLLATMMNRYEYPGIRRVWDVSRRLDDTTARNTVILYFHSKGMFNSKSTNLVYTFNGKPAYKDEIERRLFSSVIDNWRHVLAQFRQVKMLNKAGYAASPEGWIWLNFWFARASYIQKLVPPIISDNRYYYEDWLVRFDKDGKWPRLWSMEFPETHKSISNADGKIEQGSGLEEGSFASSSADCLSLCKPRLPVGLNFTKHSLWKFCRPTWKDNFWGYI